VIVDDMTEETLRVDQKGRVLIPTRIRKQLGIRNVVRMRLQGGALTLEPVEDPLLSLKKLIVKGTKDVEKDIGRLRRAAERELAKGV